MEITFDESLEPMFVLMNWNGVSTRNGVSTWVLSENRMQTHFIIPFQVFDSVSDVCGSEAF